MSENLAETFLKGRTLKDAPGPYFGQYGGRWMPESLIAAMDELEQTFNEAKNDPEFIAQFQRLSREYSNRPSLLTEVPRFSEHAGARVFLKREDLNHTGSHKINNVIGQALLAQRMGKTRLIAETGAGQHGVATATAAALFGMECVVYMGEEDTERQALNVARMQLLGAKVIAVQNGSRTLKDAINEALRDWVANVENTHYLLGTAAGAHPFPAMVRFFHDAIGSETREQIRLLPGACLMGWLPVWVADRTLLVFSMPSLTIGTLKYTGLKLVVMASRLGAMRRLLPWAAPVCFTAR